MGLARALNRILKRLGLGAVLDVSVLFAGWVHFRKAGITPERAHWALVSLFCRTGGLSNDLMHRLIARRRSALNIDGEGVLGVRKEQLPQIADQLKEHGYYVFEHRLPTHLRDRLLTFALAEKAVVRIDKHPALEIYDRKNPKGVRYDFSESTILKSDAAQELMAESQHSCRRSGISWVRPGSRFDRLLVAYILVAAAGQRCGAILPLRHGPHQMA